jgi:SWI/SNF-related matrix-associated actin-dependent regulator of chromatin subfamily A3
MPPHNAYAPAAAASSSSSAAAAAAAANSNNLSYLNRPPSMTTALFGGKRAAGALPLSTFNPFAAMRTPSASPPAAASSSVAASPSATVDLRSNSDDDEASDNKLGTILCLVFGMKMCPGKAAAKETVVLHRIHTGADSNAIRVDNVISQPCGVLNKDTAAALAPLIDNKMVRVEARVGTLTEQEMGLRVDLYGQTKDRKAVERHLRKFPMVNYLSLHDPQPKQPRHAGLDAFLQAHGGVGGAAGAAGGDSAAGSSGPGLSVREIESDLDSLFGAELDLALMPLAETPSSIRTALHPYQRQGLAWMIQHEERRVMNVEGKNELMMGWTKQTSADGRIIYYNQLTKESQSDPPELARGGLLADEVSAVEGRAVS